MALIKKKIVNLLSALLDATDSNLLANLQAQVYQTVEMVNMTREKFLKKCVDVYHIIRTVNDYCEEPTEINKTGVRLLIQRIKDC